MKPALSAAHFHTEEAALEYVEAHLWPNGPVCPHCTNTDAARIGRLQGKTTRPGLRKCYACRKPFTVRMGTVFESSHAPLRIWLQVTYLICSSKKGISTRQIHRTIGGSMTTAWFLAHRVRHAMDPNADGHGGDQMGGEGKTVEADETYLTRSKKTKRTGLEPHQRSAPQVFALVERDGPIRSMLVDHTSVRDLATRHMHKDSRLVTDAANWYKGVRAASHESVNHSAGEYVRGDVHTNTLEGFFSILKRGLVGVYQHVDKKHLDRYLAEFDFRQNTRAKLGINDSERTGLAVKGAKGKRLTYRTTDREVSA